MFQEKVGNQIEWKKILHIHKKIQSVMVNHMRFYCFGNIIEFDRTAHGGKLRQDVQVQERTFKTLGLWREVPLETSGCR